MNQIIDVVEWLQERAFRMYGPTMEAAHTKTKEWLWADEITRLRAELAAVTAERDRMREASKKAQVTFDATWSEADLLRIKNKEQRREIEKLREALQRIDGMATMICMRADAGYGMTVETVMPIYEIARAVLEGVTDKKEQPNDH